MPRLQRALTLYKRGRRYYRYGKQAVGAARMVQSAWRRYRKRRATKFGKRITAAKKTRARARTIYRPTTNATTDINYGRLEINTVAFQSLEGTQISGRQGDTVYVKGLEFCTWVYNIPTSNAIPGTGVKSTVPIEFHWALCQLKAPLEELQNFKVDEMNTKIRNYISPHFFRNRQQQFQPPTDPRAETNDGYSRAFNDPTLATDWQLEQLCSPLNSDRFNIITHKRFRLLPKGEETIANGTWMKKIKKYFPLNKKVQFSGNTDVFGKFPFFTCMWWQVLDPTDHPQNDQLNVRYASYVEKQTTWYK